MKATKTTKTTESHYITFTEQDIAKLISKEIENQTGYVVKLDEIDFDVASGGFLRGAEVRFDVEK